MSTVVAPRFPALELPEVNVALTPSQEAVWTTVRRGDELSSTRYEMVEGQLRAEHMKGTRL